MKRRVKNRNNKNMANVPVGGASNVPNKQKETIKDGTASPELKKSALNINQDEEKLAIDFDLNSNLGEFWDKDQSLNFNEQVKEKVLVAEVLLEVEPEKAEEFQVDFEESKEPLPQIYMEQEELLENKERNIINNELDKENLFDDSPKTISDNLEDINSERTSESMEIARNDVVQPNLEQGTDRPSLLVNTGEQKDDDLLISPTLTLRSVEPLTSPKINLEDVGSDFTPLLDIDLVPENSKGNTRNYKPTHRTSSPHLFNRTSKFKLHEGNLDLEIRPGIAIGEFYLGQSINTVIANLNANTAFIPTVDFIYDPKEPFSKDFALHLRNNGVILYFDPSLQTLKEVVIIDLTKVRLTYRGRVCSSEKIILTSALVHKMLGPTYPGHRTPDNEQYLLDYPGLSFHFAIPAQFRDVGATQETELPLEFPDCTAPICHRLAVYAQRSYRSQNQSRPDVLTPDPITNQQFIIKAVPKFGILMDVQTHPTGGTGTIWLRLGHTTAQEARADLGAPNRIFYKDDDKMDIHKHNPAFDAHSSASTDSNPKNLASRSDGYNANPSDYFYNYFGLGIDLLFDGDSHHLTKVILHCNAPNHFNFNVYGKAHFQLPSTLSSTSHPTVDLDASHWLSGDSKFTTFEVSWGKPAGRPVVFDRSFGKYHNPFKPTTLRGFPNDTLFEVLENGHLASVTLF